MYPKEKKPKKTPDDIFKVVVVTSIVLLLISSVTLFGLSMLAALKLFKILLCS